MKSVLMIGQSNMAGRCTLKRPLHYKCNNKWGCRLAKILLMRQPRCIWSIKWVASFARNMPCTKCPLRYPSQAAPSNCATWQAVCPSA